MCLNTPTEAKPNPCPCSPQSAPRRRHVGADPPSLPLQVLLTAVDDFLRTRVLAEYSGTAGGTMPINFQRRHAAFKMFIDPPCRLLDDPGALNQ